MRSGSEEGGVLKDTLPDELSFRFLSKYWHDVSQYFNGVVV